MPRSQPQQYVEVLIGQRCVHVTNSAGSVVLIDFMAEGNDARRAQTKSRKYTLIVDSPWRLQTHDRVLCDWNAENSRGGELLQCITRLTQRTVRSVQVSLPALDLMLTFDDELQLVVFSDRDVNREHAWTLYGLEGGALVVGPTGWQVEPGLLQSDGAP